MSKTSAMLLAVGIAIACTGIECLSPSAEPLWPSDETGPEPTSPTTQPEPEPPTTQPDAEPPATPPDLPCGNTPASPDYDSTMTDAALSLVLERVHANRTDYFIYENADSGFNHGFPSGFFGDSIATLARIGIETACVDDPDSADGCSNDPARLDCDRGTVLRISFDPLLPGEYVGLNIEEPEHWGAAPRGAGYDLTGATAMVFDVRSPTPSGLWVQFGMGGSVWNFVHIAQSTTFSTLRLQIDSLRHPGTGRISLPDLNNTHLLFSIATNDVRAPRGGVILLDNIRLEPVPGNRESVIGFPMANEVYGVVHRQVPDSGRVAFPLDQVLANVTTTYESALAALTLLHSAEPHPVAARTIVDAFVYALANDNAGLPLPVAAGGATGLHNAYSSGDLALFNGQGPSAGQAGDVRLAGFTAGPELCGDNGYCLVLDGATGGNNAFAMLALLTAYEQFEDARYRDAARTIGRWMIGNLSDTSGSGYGGFYLGYPDEGISPKTLIRSKSTENNADIYAALTRLATIEQSLGKDAEAEQWSQYAAAAAAFVFRMYDPARGCFHAGTVPVGSPAGPGILPTGPRQGDDVINVFDFLDSNTFSTLALTRAYPEAIDWRRPVQYVLDAFAQSVTVGGQEFHGFCITSAPTAGPNGIAWEFTGQVVTTLRFVDALYGESCFEPMAVFYLEQIRQARQSAPFSDGRGLVASTLEDGDILPPIEQCLSTPFQCIPERVGLAATTWAIFAEQRVNPLATERPASESDGRCEP